MHLSGSAGHYVPIKDYAEQAEEGLRPGSSAGPSNGQSPNYSPGLAGALAAAAASDSPSTSGIGHPPTKPRTFNRVQSSHRLTHRPKKSRCVPSSGR